MVFMMQNSFDSFPFYSVSSKINNLLFILIFSGNDHVLHKPWKYVFYCLPQVKLYKSSDAGFQITQYFHIPIVHIHIATYILNNILLGFPVPMNVWSL